MSILKAAVIGCGKPESLHPDGKHGFAIAYAHGRGYRESKEVDLVAAADIDSKNLDAYVKEFGLMNGYTDYKEMLEKEKPDIVSICTWPKLHKEMVIESARQGVKGILCEKPMSFHYKDCKEMQEVCNKHGVILNICHQRRFENDFVEVKKAILSGEIGSLLRIETWVGDGWDLMSWGTHWVDIMRYYNNDLPVDYVFAQADISERVIRYQYPAENQLLMQMKFENGVYGILHHSKDPIEHGNIVVGDKGVAILAPDINSKTTIIGKKGIREIQRKEGTPSAYCSAIENLKRSVQNGIPSELDSTNALINMQIIMATYESARTNKAINMPFEPELNPLEQWVKEIIKI